MYHPVTPLTGLCRDRSGGTDTRNPVLIRLESQREEQIRFIEDTLARVEDESRDLVDAETRNLEAARERIRELDAQIEPLEAFEELRATHRTTTSRYSSTSRDRDTGRREAGPDGRSLAYTEGRQSPEYRSAGHVIVDRILAFDGDNEARDRLAAANLTRDCAWADRGGSQSRVVATQTTADTPGLLPRDIIGTIDNDLDTMRPFMSSIGVKDLGSVRGKNFDRPIITQHSQVGKQTGEKVELPSRKMVIGSVPFTKDTYGGTLNVSRQDIDWTSPEAWNAIITDLQDEYAIETENAAADAFAAIAFASVENQAAVGQAGTLQQIATALYGAASNAYNGVKRLPNMVWMSLDMWALYGPVLDSSLLAMTNQPGAGTESSLATFEGNVMRLPRIVVPSFPNGTIVVGVKEKTEVYEQRIGLLQVVEPSILGVEIAYGGYLASGTLRNAAFSKIVNAV